MTAISTPTPVRDRLPYWFSAGHLCIDWPFGAIYLIAPVAGAEFGWSSAQIGLLLTIQSIGAALAYLPAGKLMDTMSNRGRLLTTTFFWVIVGYMLASYAQGFWPLALLMAIASMGDAAWHPMATGILVKAAPGQRARVLGIHAIGGAMSGVFAPLLAGYLLTYFDWRETLQLVLIPTLIMGTLFLFYVSKQVPNVTLNTLEKFDIRSLLRVWMTPFGLVLLVMMVTYNLGLVGAFAMTPLYLKEAQGLTILETSFAYSGILLIGSLLQPRMGRMADSVGRFPLIIIGSAISVAASLTVFSGVSLPVTLISLAVCIGGLTAVRSVVLACAVDLSPKGEATTLGIAFAVLDGVGAFGAVSAGYFGRHDLSYVFLMTAACSTGACIAALSLKNLRLAR